MVTSTKGSIVVSYVPTVLRSMTEICEVLGVGERQVKIWAKNGAPVVIEGEGTRTRYSAELMRLHMWREKFSK